MHHFDEALYKALPNLYALCLTDSIYGTKRVVAGLIIKTSFTHHDSEFIDAITALAKTIPNLSDLVSQQASFLPARLGVMGQAPLLEDEMLSIMIKQSLKHSSAGSA
jgi:hypothetical protein